MTLHDAGFVFIVDQCHVLCCLQSLADRGQGPYPRHVHVLRQQSCLHGCISCRHQSQSPHDEPDDAQLAACSVWHNGSHDWQRHGVSFTSLQGGFRGKTGCLDGACWDCWGCHCTPHPAWRSAAYSCRMLHSRGRRRSVEVAVLSVIFKSSSLIKFFRLSHLRIIS